MPKAKKQTFSKVKEAKANARARVGTPPPERVLAPPGMKRREAPRFRETLTDLVTRERDHEESK